MPAQPVDLTARRQRLMDRMAAARQQGVSWEAIHTSLNNRVEAARKAGVSQEAIQQSLGFTSADELIEATRVEAKQHLEATKPTSWVGAFINGVTHSSTAALLGVKPDQGQVHGHSSELAANIGETVGDVPAMIVGGIMGAVGAGAAGVVGGGAAGGAAGTAVEPVGGTAVGAAGGAVAVGGIAAYVGAGAGSNALPQFIKSQRDRYAQALMKGQVRGPEDYLKIQSLVLKDTAEAAAVGGLTGYVGGRVAPVLERMGASNVTKFVAKAGAEGATMVAAQSALAGHMPKMEDFVDAAVTIGAFHVAHGVASKAGPGYHAIRTRLAGNYVETGELPQAAAARAVHDPILRAKLLGVPDPHMPPGSSRTQLMASTSPSVHGHVPLPTDVFMLPRTAGSFDPALEWMFKAEGGMTTDTGGLTKYGISAKAHPGLDIANLSRADAAEIYHKEYWRSIDADALPPNMRLAAFDSAVNQGVGQTKTWLREANGDLQTFMKLRIEKYAQLARDPKYAKYAKGWANRLKHLGVSETAADVIHRGPDNVGREFSPEDVAALDLDGSGAGRPPGGGGDGPTGPAFIPGDEGSLSRVKSRIAPHEDVDWMGKTMDGFTRVYGELFDPTHPIRRLVDGATKGEPLDDYHNPELLFRVAENSSTVAQWAITKEMVDLEGNVTGHGLQDIISGKSTGAKFSKAETRDFLDGYALSKWAVMMDAQGKKTGISLDDAKRVIADHGGKFEAAFQHLVEWRNSTLKWLSDGGVHNKAKVDKLIEENGSTIPGYRRMDDGSWRPTSTGKPGIWNPIKTAMGSERQIEPILKSLMQDAFLRHELAVNNRAMAAIADLGIEGNKATQGRAIDMNVVSAIEALKEQGISEDMLSSLARSAGAMVPKDEVPVFRDGKLFGVKFEDAELTRVLRGYDQTAQSTVMKVIASITSVPRNFQTRYNPLFPLRNLFYDLPQQVITNPDAMQPLSGMLEGLGHMAGDPEGYAAWARSGGAERVYDDISKDAFMKRVLQGHEEPSLVSNAWNAVRTPFDALTTWTRLVSTPMRLGRYTQGLKAGESPLRAAVASAETATPRASFGGPVGKAWNSIAPYTTAYLNGLEKTVRATLGLGRTATGVKYDARKTFIKGATLITLPMVAQWFAVKDEDWYKAMPEWQKNNAWFIIPPLGDMPAIPIAAPPLISTLFVGVPRMLLEAFVADNPHVTDNIWKTLGASLMPPTWATGASILTPIVEHVANYSFQRERPLVSDSTVRGVQPAEQFTQYSSQTAKDLAQFASDLPLVHSNLGWSPAVIDNYISQWGGPMGKAAALAAGNALGDPTNQAPAQKVSDWPGIASWVTRYPSASAAPIQQFNDTTAKLDQMHGSLLAQIREGNFDAFKRIVDQGGPSAAAWQQLNLGQKVPTGVDLGPYLGYLAQVSSGADFQNLTLAHQAEGALKNARQYSWSVYENHDMTGEDKRQILDMVNAQMQVIAERGNEAMDRAMIGVKRPGASGKAPVPDNIFFEPPAAEGQ